MNKIAPDFEGVYYLVLDMIDKYNELWQNESNKIKGLHDGNVDGASNLVNKVLTYSLTYLLTHLTTTYSLT
jgi:flagellar capping protein FliD